MQLYDESRRRIGNLTGYKERKITTTLDSGDKEMEFKYPNDGKMISYLKEEAYLRTDQDEYVIRSIKRGEQYLELVAQLNVEELEMAVFPYGFESVEQTVQACLEFAFEDTGWHVGECEITKKRTIRKEDATTAWEVLQSCLSTYRCECKIDSINKIVNLYEQIGSYKGRYFMERLNLRKLTVSSNTYDLYTQIMPIGKDGITIKWLGKEYLENYQYSKKKKLYVWKDERYTNTSSLIEDGTAKLEEMSKPYVAYEAEVIDLARSNRKYRKILDYEIGDSVWIVSKKNGIKELQRIVKIVEYPEEPKKNTVELSNLTKTFAELQQEEEEKSKEETTQIVNSTVKKTLGDGYYTKEEVDSHISASEKEISIAMSKKVSAGEVVDALNSEMLLNEKCIRFETGGFIVNAKNLQIDEEGNATYSGDVKGKTITIESSDLTYSETMATSTSFHVDGKSALINQYYDDQSGGAGGSYYTKAECGTQPNEDETDAEVLMMATKYKVSDGETSELTATKFSVDPYGAYINGTKILPAKFLQYDDATERTLAGNEAANCEPNFPDPEEYGMTSVLCYGGHPNGTTTVTVQGNGWIYNTAQTETAVQSVTWYLIYY